MTQGFDDLSRALARKLPRRLALKGAVGGGIAAVAASMFPRSAWAAARATNFSTFCTSIYGAGTPEAQACFDNALSGTGPVFLFGPSSAACQGNNCPPGTMCVSQIGYSPLPYQTRTLPGRQPGTYICVPTGF